MAGIEDRTTADEIDDLRENARSVARLNREIESALQGAREAFPSYVVGEVSDVNRYEFGTFFELRDIDEEAAVSCIAWASAVENFDRDLEDGTAAIVRASVDFYPERGDTQLVVSNYWPIGDADRTRELEELRERLDAEGLLDDERRRSLPPYPNRIGLVTSPSGSAREDFESAVRSRDPGAMIQLAPATVQGENAVPSIVASIRTLDADDAVDAIAVTRGGSSGADLWQFNEEPLVRAIADCTTPVVVAVGHEDDRTLAEAVADRRAMTPTDAGVTIAPDMSAVRAGVGRLERRIDETYHGFVDGWFDAYERRIEAAGTALEQRVTAKRAECRRAADLEVRIDRAYRMRVERELDALESRLERAYRDVETESRIEAGTAAARRLRIVVAILLAVLVLGVVLVVVLVL